VGRCNPGPPSLCASRDFMTGFDNDPKTKPDCWPIARGSGESVPMMRAMTAFGAVATAFAFFSPEALARATSHPHADSRVHVAKPGAGHSRHRTEAPAEGAEGPGKKRETSGSRLATRNDDGLLEFEEPADAPGVTGRSKSIMKLEAAPADEHHGKKHAKGRRARPLPPNASWRPYRREPWRRGYVSVSGHGKSWSGFLVGRDGEVLPAARRSLSAALASWRTGKEMLMDEQLLALISDVSDEFGGRPIRIVSGYREHSFAPGSKHKMGQAFDFSVPGVPNEALRDFLRTLPDVGVGYYPNSTHVHLDVREKFTYWVDYSTPGAHPLYSYDRRVAKMTPAQRQIAAALDALAARREPLGRPATAGVERRVPLALTTDESRAKSAAPPPRAAFQRVELAPALPALATVPDAGSFRRAVDADAGVGHDAGAARPDAGARPAIR
jgi:hypothetical protein